MVVGAFLSLNELADYSLAFSLVSIPWFIFGQVGSSIMLPIMSRAQDDPVKFCQRYRICVEYAGVSAVVLTLPLIVVGEQIVTLLYGSKYAGTGVLMALLGAASALRFLRFVPSIAAMARADTINQLHSNVWRGLSLPLATAVALMGGRVALIAACALLAELIASAVSLLRLHRCQGVPLRNTAGAAVYVLSFLGAGFALVWLGTSQFGYWYAVAVMLAVHLIAIVVAWFSFPDVVRSVLDATGRKWTHTVPQPASNSSGSL